MDWAAPHLLWLFLPGLALLWWFQRRSTHPMPPARQRALLIIRSLGILLVLLALAGPAGERLSTAEAVVFVVDHSASQGRTGLAAAAERIAQLSASLPGGTATRIVSVGEHASVQPLPFVPDPRLAEQDGGQSDLAAGVALARGLFPAGATPRMVLLSDGFETRGDLETAAREAAVSGVRMDVVPVAGELR
ncbi:MAG TPA: vWA domain-containing protein, partial [Chthoniobacteraceae bacterium]